MHLVAAVAASIVVGNAHGITQQRGPNALYDIGSVAKTFTAAAVLDLAEHGRLRLDERLRDLLPAVPADKRDITVTELLTHTSGLPPYLGSDQVRLGYAGALRRIFMLPVSRRGRFVYSDAGYTLLAAIVQRVAHEPFRQYVRRRLFAPARLTATGFVGDASLRGKPLAHGITGGRDRGPAGSQAPLSWSILGAGGILATASDLYRWTRALQRGTVLAPRWRAAMWRGRVRTGAPGDAQAAFGWVVGNDRRGRKVIAVGGGTDFGYTSDIRIYGRRQVVTVVLSANDAQPAPAIARGLAPS